MSVAFAICAQIMNMTGVHDITTSHTAKKFLIMQ